MKNKKNKMRHPASFRDPDGFIFYQNNTICRQVNFTYKSDYDHLVSSGLYSALIEKGLLIPHKETKTNGIEPEIAYKVIKPEKISFISYPHEWCFSQLKEAAKCMLEIQKIALQYGMSLKDCSGYNIQFKKCRPVLIDTLSFERYREGKPWVAYRQFCRHFLGPLALMSYKDVRLNQLFRVYIDGIPLDLASSLLPLRTYLNPALLTHIHLHAKSQKHFSNRAMPEKIHSRKMSRRSLLGFIDSLEAVLYRLKWKPDTSFWAGYYQENNYTRDAFNKKKQIVIEYLKKINPLTVWDFGSNEGLFSRIAGNLGGNVISFDNDPAAVEINYCKCIKQGKGNILPLIIDLTNPTPGIGWANQERMSLIDRGPADMVLALALIHHLVISNNLLFKQIARLFQLLCSSLIIEFIPKQDSQVQRMLSTREDIFQDYSEKDFEIAFSKYFDIQSRDKINESERILYLMKSKKIQYES